MALVIERPENVAPHADGGRDEHQQPGELLQRVLDAPQRHTGEEITARRDEQGVEALPGAGLIGVVIVVPPLAHGEESEQPVVAGVIAGHITPAAVNMRERASGESKLRGKKSLLVVFTIIATLFGFLRLRRR